ncbi:uncharacterized protein LOC144876887 [Branchiostoma floridae x Branchiostoma japonicum]
MRLPTLFAGLVLNVFLSGVHRVHADITSPPCDVSDHLHECLCSYPEYHVRRMRRSLWVSTTVWDLSPSSGRERALKKLQQYLHGHNNQGVTIPREWPLTTQTYVPTGFLREVTVALPLPEEEWISPPVPEDPTVVLDVVPETVLYVKSFRRRGDLGFSAQREAQKLLHLLIANKEPIVRRDDYYYILQHGGDGSTLRERYEVAIFATSAVLDEFYRGTDGPGERLLRLPRCLRGNDSLWSSGGASIHADLVRRDCGTTFCYGPDCPAYTIQSNDGHGVERRSYRTVGPLMRADPFMCQFDRARQQGQKIMFQKLKEEGLASPGRNFSRFSPVVTAVVQAEPRGGPCSRTYASYMPVPRDVITRVNQEKTESFGSTCQDLSGYVLCFGGHGGAETAFEAGRRLSSALANRGASFSDEAMAVVEYNVQSRVFDRHNEVFMETRDSENGCLHTDSSGTQGQNSLDFTLTKDWFEGADITSPDLQHPCTKAPCPHNKITRTFDHFKEHHYMKTRWVCTQERSCEAAAGRDKAMAGLLFYINGRNDDRATIEMMQPVLTIHNVTEVSSPACDKMFTVCLSLPTGYHDNPPRPVDTQVYISEPVEELELFSLHFSPRVGGMSRDLYMSELGHNVTAEMDSMPEHFDVRCEKEMIAELLFMTTEDEKWHELAFFRKVPTQLLAQTDSQADDVHVQYDACQNDACFLHEKVRDWDGFTEFRFDIGKWVCMKTAGCESGNPRDVFLALTSYFGGKNVAGRALGNMMAPVVMQYKNISKDEEPFSGSCHEELEACAPLPRYYQRKNAPAPTEEGLMLRQVVTPSMYIISLKGHITSAQLSLELETLKHKLQETGLQFDKSGNLFYTYDEPFTEVDRRVTYTGFWKLQTVG